MGVNGREYDRSGGVRAMPSPKGGLQTPKGATHTGGGGLVYGDGSWDLTVFVTDLQEFFRKQKYFLTRSSAILTLVCFYNGTQKTAELENDIQAIVPLISFIILLPIAWKSISLANCKIINQNKSHQSHLFLSFLGFSVP